MKKLFLLLSTTLLLSQTFFAIEAEKTMPKSIISTQWENDFRFSDRYYTNGMKLNYTSPSDEWWTSYLQFKLLKAIFPSDRQVFETIAIGQDMKVGVDINDANPPLTDHPYSGWLYFSSGAHMASENSLDSFTITLGLVGPQSYAGDLQRGYHDFINADDPKGWGNQIKNEPAFILSYNHAERIYTYNFTDAFSTDFIASAGANLGNKITEGRAKGLFRIGFNMPKSFEMNRIDSAGAQDVVYFTGKESDWHMLYYAGFIGRVVGYDICLDGNTMARSRSVDIEHLVGEAVTGISARYDFIQLELNWSVTSRTFETQTKDYQMFWTATMKFLF